MTSQDHLHDEITMDEITMDEEYDTQSETDADAVLGKNDNDSDVIAVMEQVKAKYANMSVDELEEIVEFDKEIDELVETELKDESILFPPELMLLLPALNSSTGQAPENIKVPIKIKLNSMALYLYEYDGEDTAMAYYTCELGSILGSTQVSIEGLSTIRFKTEFHWEQDRFKRDLAWSPDTTLQKMQEQNMFASEEYIKAEQAEVKAILAARASQDAEQTSDAVAANNLDEDVF